jgi:hypothetical protein
MGNHDSYSDSPRALVGWHHQSLLGAREPTLLWNHFAHGLIRELCASRNSCLLCCPEVDDEPYVVPCP